MVEKGRLSHVHKKISACYFLSEGWVSSDGWIVEGFSASDLDLFSSTLY